MTTMRATAPITTHPILPPGMFFDQVRQLLRNLRADLGLSHSRLAALLAMMDCTSPADWTDPTRDAVCYRRQQDMARSLGKTPRALRDDEAALERMQLIARHTGADGHRNGALLSDGSRLGMSFAPLIRRLPDLLRLQDQRAAEDRACLVRRLECSAAKRALRAILDQLSMRIPEDARLCDLQHRYEQWPRRYASFSGIEAFDRHLAEIEDAISEANDLLECCTDSSGAAVSVLPTIQTTNQPESVICSGSPASRRTARKRADTDLSVAGPYGPANAGEKECGSLGPDDKPSDLSWLTPAILRQIASSDFRFYLDAIASDGPITERCVIRAAIHRVPELGISPSAWEDYAEFAGDFRAAIAVLVIDANRAHPVGPVRSAGGMLRAFSRLDRAGKLNLAGSLIGLRERSMKL